MRHLGIVLFCAAISAAVTVPREMEQARDRQDRPALERMVATYGAAATKQSDAQSQYMLALANSYLAEIRTELRDKEGARSSAESGIQAAEKAVALNGKTAEYHRVLGTLCGQVIPANVLAGLKYGKCALDSINKAIDLDPKSALAYVSRGVGNYYLPASFGGGAEPALKDIEKAVSLDPKLAEAYLWKGIVLRKLNRNAEAREALSKALELNPDRVWIKQQLEKTPAK